MFFVFLLIKKNKSGIFNVSIGKKVYLKKIVKWLNYYNLNKYKIMKISKKNLHTLNRESFYLNNSKLISDNTTINELVESDWDKFIEYYNILYVIGLIEVYYQKDTNRDKLINKLN